MQKFDFVAIACVWLSVFFNFVFNVGQAQVLDDLNQFACNVAELCDSNVKEFIEVLNLVGSQGLTIRVRGGSWCGLN